MYKHVFIRKRKRKKPTMWIDSSAFLLLYLRIRINTRKPPFLFKFIIVYHGCFFMSR